MSNALTTASTRKASRVALFCVGLALILTATLSSLFSVETHVSPYNHHRVVQLTVLHTGTEYGYNGSEWFRCEKGEC